MDEEAIRVAVEAADTYKAAAEALKLPYQQVYTAAKRRGWKPKLIAQREARPSRQPAWAPPPPSFPELVWTPAPEATPPRLSAWGPVPLGVTVKGSAVRVRLDQENRVRAEISDLREGWCCWVVRDAKGTTIGKIHMVASMHGREVVEAEEAADRRLAELGWLPRNHAAITEPCTATAPACEAPRPPVVRDPLALLSEQVLAAPPADQGRLGVELARAVLVREREALAEGW